MQVARSILMESCGVYGDHMLAAIGNINPNHVVIRDCNNADINALAALQGVNTANEAMLSMAGFFGPISHGWNS